MGSRSGPQRKVAVGLPGKNDPDGVWIALPHLGQKFGSIHPRHPDVGHDDIELVLHHRQGRAPRRHSGGRKLVLPFQREGDGTGGASRPEDSEVVIDEQNPLHAFSAALRTGVHTASDTFVCARYPML